MKARLDFRRSSPEGAKAMSGLHGFVRGCGLETSLLELVKLRASQINGCAHCIDMHTKELRAMGEDEQRLYLLDAWRESPFYSERERAALGWCEAVTRIAETRAPDDCYEAARAQFKKKELVESTFTMWRSMGLTGSTSHSHDTRRLSDGEGSLGRALGKQPWITRIKRVAAACGGVPRRGLISGQFAALFRGQDRIESDESGIKKRSLSGPCKSCIKVRNPKSSAYNRMVEGMW